MSLEYEPSPQPLGRGGDALNSAGAGAVLEPPEGERGGEGERWTQIQLPHKSVNLSFVIANAKNPRSLRGAAATRSTAWVRARCTSLLRSAQGARCLTEGVHKAVLQNSKSIPAQIRQLILYCY